MWVGLLPEEKHMAISKQETTLVTFPGDLKSQEMLLNMGPQHPSVHGVLRLVLTLEGETVVDCTPVIGYLHRGIEKILENRPVMGGIRYMAIEDYLAPMLIEIALVVAVEPLLCMNPTRRSQLIVLLVVYMQRITCIFVPLCTTG